jgi:5-formyltetrahydrofolate cyclo-ligase
LTTDKPALRTAFTARRAALFAAQPLAGLTLAARLPQLDSQPGVVAGYWPMRSEIDPRPLMTRFVRAGWRIALPVTPARRMEGPLAFRVWTGGAEMATHAFGMREPHPGAEAARPDVVLVPLLAFDAAGHRLGYGAGHYDRTLQRLRTEGPVRALGLAFAGQEAAGALPAGPQDQPLDAILTEREFRAFLGPGR